MRGQTFVLPQTHLQTRSTQAIETYAYIWTGSVLPLPETNRFYAFLGVYGNREMKGRERRGEGEGEGRAIVRERERGREKLPSRNRRVLERNCSGCPSPTDGSDAV